MGALKTLSSGSVWVSSVVFSDQWLLSASLDGSMQVLEVIEKHDVKTRNHFALDGCGTALTDTWMSCAVAWGQGPAHQDCIIGKSNVFHPSVVRNGVLGADYDGNLQDLAGNKRKVHSGPIVALAVSPDLSLLYSASADHSVSEWQVAALDNIDDRCN
jgi:WD40 repeat protein